MCFMFINVKTVAHHLAARRPPTWKKYDLFSLRLLAVRGKATIRNTGSAGRRLPSWPLSPRRGGRTDTMSRPRISVTAAAPQQPASRRVSRSLSRVRVRVTWRVQVPVITTVISYQNIEYLSPVT